MTAPPPTPEEIALGTAQSDLTTATTNSTTAHTSASTAIDSAVSGLETTLDGLVTARDGAIDTATGNRDTQVNVIQGTLQTALDGLRGTLNGDLDTFEGTLDGAMASAKGIHQSAVDAAQGVFDNDVTTIENTLDSDLDSTRGTFTGAVAGFETTFDSNLAAPQATFTTDMSTANAGFASTFTTQSASYDTQEAAFWSTYQTAVGSGSTGLISVFNSALSMADSTLATALLPYSNVVYDPSLVTDSTSFQAFQQSQQDSLQLALNTLQTNYQNAIQAELDGFNVDLGGSTGVFTSFHSSIIAEEADYDGDLAIAQGAFDTSIQGFSAAYETAVNGPGGLRPTLNTQVANEQSDFDGDIAAARTIYNTSMATPTSTFESTRGGLVNDYRNFVNNTGSNSITETVTITEISSTNYQITHTAVMNATTTTWTENTSSRPDALPTGVTTVTITQTSTGGNPYESALAARLVSLEEQFDAIDEAYSVQVATATVALDTSVRSADQAYWDNVFGPSSGFNAYVSSTQSAIGFAATTVQNAYNQYQTNSSAAMSSYAMAMMTAMMSGNPMPPPPNFDALKKTFWEKESVADAIGADATGALLVSFVATERAFDTTRDTAIINAAGIYLQALETAENARQVSRDNAIGGYNQDVLAIDHAFMADAAARLVVMTTGIETAFNAYELAHNAALEIYRTAGNDAVKEYEKDVANHVESFRQQEATQFQIFQTAAAGSYQTLVTAQTAALVERIDDGAGLALTLEQGVNAALATREQNLAGLAAIYRANVTGTYLTHVTTVSTQLASDYSAYFGFAGPETAVALAYAGHTTSQVGAWANALNTEATSYQSYVNSESGQRQSINDALAAADHERISGTVGGPLGITDALFAYLGNIASEAVTLISNSAVAAEAFEQSVATHERTANQGYSDKGHLFNNAVVASRKILSDSGANSGMGYMNSGYASVGTYASYSLTPSLAATQGIAAENDLLAGSIESEVNTESLGRISNESSTTATLMSADDSLIVSQAEVMVAQRSVQFWQRAVDYQDAPDSYFTNMTPTASSPWTLLAVFIPVPAPTNPSAPPPPPSAPAVSPTPTPAKDVEFENPYWEGFKGAMHGFFVTGPKAVVNSTVDTVGGFVSLGQWDPPDVIAVDPITDLGYDAAAAVARVGTEAALAAATGGLGAVSRVGKVVNAVDTLGNVVNGVQGGINAAQNGLTLQNGMQIATGLIGAGQATKAAKDALKSTSMPAAMEQFCFSPDTLISTSRGQQRLGDMQPGDRVHAFDFSTGQWVLSTVQQRHDNPYTGDWVTVRIGESSLEATANHPFWVIEGDQLRQRPRVSHLSVGADEGQSLPGRWINSQDLQRGDAVLCVDGQSRRVDRIEVRPVENHAVCNLTIERHHSFAVGEFSVLAHNTGFCDILTASGRKVPGALEGVPNVHGHHIVQKTVPAGYAKISHFDEVQPGWSRDMQRDWYIGKSQELMVHHKVPILETKDLAQAAAARGDTLHNLCWAINGKGTHSMETTRYVYQQLAEASDGAQVQAALRRIANEFESGAGLSWL